MSSRAADRLYGWLVDDSAAGASPETSAVDADAAGDVPSNAARQIGALLLTKAGDRIVDPKTVLAWLLTAVGAPAAMIGLLVPIRESGSMLPQAALIPWVMRVRRRSTVWIVGAIGQAAAVVAMAVVVATASGTAAGVLVLLALTVFALCRSLSSIATKDVLGRTIPQGQRGRVTGLADSGSGVIAIVVGLGLASFGASTAGGSAAEGVDAVAFAWLLLAAAGAWLAAVAIYAGIREPTDPPATDRDRGRGDEVAAARDRGRGDDREIDAAVGAMALLRDDAPFRRFVAARTLLLVSALTPPYIVTIATDAGGSAIGALGPFVVASGIASLIGGRLWGGFADRSSRQVIVVACGCASVVVLIYIGLLQIEGMAGLPWLHPGAYFLLALIHTGARVGRSTYVVDLGGGDRRTAYVAVSNTVMGVLLLVVGALTAAISAAGSVAALLALAAIGAVGVPVARGLPEV